MEPYSLEEFTIKVKREIQVLLYILEAKTGIRTKASNIRPSVWKEGAVIYFEIEINYETSDPDIGSFTHELNRFDDILIDFFGKVVLTPKADFKILNDRPKDSDDMIGLFMGINFEWGDSYNTTAKFAFEYNLYYSEYGQYYD